MDYITVREAAEKWGITEHWAEALRGRSDQGCCSVQPGMDDSEGFK